MKDESARLVPNTLGVRCVAEQLRVARSEEDLAEQLTDADRRGLPVTLVGGGSNFVLRPRLPGLALLLRLGGMTFERLGRRTWRVTASAGETWHDLVRATLGRGIPGLENLALIPGTVGAAPVQNIGAYGRELGEVLETVTVFDRHRGAFRTLPARECGLRYRASRFRGPGSAGVSPAFSCTGDGERFAIVRVALLLGVAPLRCDYPDVRRELGRMGVAPAATDAARVAEAVVRVRRRKLPDPGRIGNVGSFFKNPLVTPKQLDDFRARLDDLDAYPAPDAPGHRKISAARLIDAAGWKGVCEGAMQVWPRQPLVLVNRGGATGNDALALAAAIQSDVRDKYGVALELEPTVAGV